MKISVRQAKKILAAMDAAARWIAIGEEGEHDRSNSWFNINKTFDQQRAGLNALIKLSEKK